MPLKYPVEFVSGQTRLTVSNTAYTLPCSTCAYPQPVQTIPLGVTPELIYRRVYVGWVLHFGGALMIQGRLRLSFTNSTPTEIPFFWSEFVATNVATYAALNQLPPSFVPSFTSTRFADGVEFSSSPATAGSDCIVAPSVAFQTGATNNSRATLQMSPFDIVSDIDRVELLIDQAANTTAGGRTASATALLHAILAVKSQAQPW